MNKIITLVMLISTVITTHPAAPNPEIFTFKIRGLDEGGTGAILYTSLISEETLSINLAKKEENTNKTFRELQQKAYERKLPWLLAISKFSLGHTMKSIEYVDIIELMRDTYYNNQTFSSHKSTYDAIDLATAKFFMKHYSLCPKARQIYSTFYPSKKNDLSTMISLYYTIEDSAGNTLYDASDLSCTLAIALCNDYSQLELIAKSAYQVAIETKEQQDIHQAKLWLKKLVEKEQDIDAMEKLAQLYNLNSRPEKAKQYLQLTTEQQIH